MKRREVAAIVLAVVVACVALWVTQAPVCRAINEVNSPLCKD